MKLYVLIYEINMKLGNLLITEINSTCLVSNSPLSFWHSNKKIVKVINTWTKIVETLNADKLEAKIKHMIFFFLLSYLYTLIGKKGLIKKNY